VAEQGIAGICKRKVFLCYRHGEAQWGVEELTRQNLRAGSIIAREELAGTAISFRDNRGWVPRDGLRGADQSVDAHRGYVIYGATSMSWHTAIGAIGFAVVVEAATATA
jgi:hypothetical protein